MTKVYGNGKRFSNTFRFIDDFKVLNSDRVEVRFMEIYSPEMEIKKENNKSVLDLDLKIKDKKVSISLYDKRDNFLFYIVREPYLCSNIPLKIFYLALGTKIYK